MPRDNDPNKIIALRRHKVILEKSSIWRLISDSYCGGETYTNNNYLHQYPREPKVEYTARKARSVFLNHVQPVADVLAGFIYTNPPERKTPKELEYLYDKCSKQKSLDCFMLSVATYSAQYPVGVLVDSPKFDPKEVKTVAARREKGLNPFCVMYMPWQIRDFAVDNKGELLWILLDNSYAEKTDPLKPEEEKTVYRLWTKMSYQDFEIPSGDKDIKASEEIPHNLGIVPFRFINWKDKDEDLLSETPFEDIALIDQAIYNNLSLMDEMVNAGTFKTLFFPEIKKGDLPAEIKHQGVGNLSVIPFPGDASHAPFFAGATLEDITNIIQVFEFFLAQLYDKVGLGTDQDKKYVQSGKAKELDFEKAASFLKAGAKSLEDCEKFIFHTAGLWEGTTYTDKDIVIKYSCSFKEEEVDALLARLFGILSLGYKSLKKMAVLKIAQKLSSDLSEAEKEELFEALKLEIEQGDLVTKIETDDLVEAERKAREEADRKDREKKALEQSGGSND